MQLPEISVETWENTYRGPDELTLDDTWKRQATACAAVEKEDVRESVYNDFMWLLTDFNGAAGGRITANLGIETRSATTLYNCFVHVPNDLKFKDPDSINGIYELLKAQAQTLKSEGGYGTNFSWLRPSGNYIRGIGGRTPGVLKFMELWDKSSEIITSGTEDVSEGRKKDEKKKIRKGAQMGILCVWHPEIEGFIDAKLTPNRYSKFNLSVGITEGFMEAVVNNSMWDLKFPDTTYKKYATEWNGDIYDWESKNYPVIIHKSIKAKDLWEKIMKATYSRNDPGVLFLDTANRMNPLSYAENIQASNPCAEITMGTGVCLLFSLNLVKYITLDNGTYSFDFEKFKKAITIAVRFADNINDISRVPLEDYKQAILDKRRIGLGVLGLGSLHYILGLRFGSKESFELIENIFKTKCETELLASSKLGKEKGSFRLFDKEKYFSSHWWKTLPISKSVKNEIEKIGEMRNSHHSANAPTGNMSLYVGVVSGGIEPVFMKQYARWVIVPEAERSALRESGFKFPDISKNEWNETEHLKLSKSGSDDILLGKFNGSEYQVDKNRGLTKKNIVEDYGWRFVKENLSDEQIAKFEKDGVFVTTDDLTVEEHVGTLKILAKYVNMNSSKTVNIKNDYSYESFKDLYLDAWKAGIKGITSYRAGTMTAVLEKVDAKHDSRPSAILDSYAPKRSIELTCDIKKVKIQGEGWTMFVGLLNGRPYEVFGGLSKYVDIPNKYKSGKIVKNGKGSDGLSTYNIVIGDGDDQMTIKDITNIFENKNFGALTRMISLSLRHGTPIQFLVEQLQKDKYSDMTSFSKVVSRVLKSYIKNGTKYSANICSECKADNSLVYQEGCVLCINCGFSKCS